MCKVLVKKRSHSLGSFDKILTVLPLVFFLKNTPLRVWNLRKHRLSYLIMDMWLEPLLTDTASILRTVRLLPEK